MSNTTTTEARPAMHGQKEALKRSLGAIRQILDALLEAITAAGKMGMASGTLYAAMLPLGCNLGQFEQLMQILVDAGRVRKIGHSHYVAI